MSETVPTPRTCTVRPLDGESADAFTLPVGTADDLPCGHPDCDEPADEYLQLELPGVEHGTAVPYAWAGFCSPQCLRGFHSLLPLVDVTTDDDGNPMHWDMTIESPPVVLGHVRDIPTDTRRQSFAGLGLKSVFDDVSDWAIDVALAGEPQTEPELHAVAIVADDNIEFNIEILADS